VTSGALRLWAMLGVAFFAWAFIVSWGQKTVDAPGANPAARGCTGERASRRTGHLALGYASAGPELHAD
jgi:hypothetical protein